MKESEKNSIYKMAKEHVKHVIKAVKKEKSLIGETVEKIEQRIKNSSAVEIIIEREVLAHSLVRFEELEHLASSPYFARCDVFFPNKKELKKIYFSKFQMSEENIYSWTSLAAVMRFENIGTANYILPNGQNREVRIDRKDQFMISNGKIIFMASESRDWERTLIYQEHLSNRKSGFILPEIVEQMEKAQDAVIRAAHSGSFLISGPAGSGKTTLAFHRIAYLTQSPDTAPNYPDYNIIVFVQDESTKEYFSALLPQLGVKNVTITTWSDWALQLLGLEDYKYVFRHGETEQEKDEYEYLKRLSLDTPDLGLRKNIIETLKQKYSATLSDKYKEIFVRQIENKLLDIFDLTILLKNKLNLEKELCVEKTVVKEDKKGQLKTAKEMIPLKYSLIVVDEAENYLAEQIKIIQTCVNNNKSILYVGDLAQQTRLGTIKNWEEVNESFFTGRKVILEKVYRNTKQILKYVKANGYDIAIPEGLSEGQEVVEIIVDNQKDEMDLIDKIIDENKNSVIGILRNEIKNSESLKKAYSKNKNVHILSIYEAQGVEFDVVILLVREEENKYIGYSAELTKEKKKINNDLHYVALTRAMSKLHVIKSC